MFSFVQYYLQLLPAITFLAKVKSILLQKIHKQLIGAGHKAQNFKFKEGIGCFLNGKIRVQG